MFAALIDDWKSLLPIGTAVVGFLLAFVWNRWWRRKDDREQSDKGTLKSHGEKLIALDGRITVVEARDDDRQSRVGRLELAQSNLEGKIGGLQDFWKSEFSSLRKELRDDHARLRDELRQDQANTETRLTALMTGHQQRVHDRLNVIAADQAKLLTEFVDSMADRKERGE